MLYGVSGLINLSHGPDNNQRKARGNSMEIEINNPVALRRREKHKVFPQLDDTKETP